MRGGFALLFLLPVYCQNTCENVAAYSPCEFAYELFGTEAQAHPDPYRDVEFHAEIRSPHFQTFLVPAYWDGAHKVVIRFTPTEAGQWTYRFTSNVKTLDGQQGTFNATESESPGYVHPANVHHWWTDNKKPHLWMGMIADRLAFNDAQEVERVIAAADAEKFNHVRVSILGGPADRARVWAGGKPNVQFFDELDRRILPLQKKGLTIDLVLGSDPDYLRALAPDWQSRERLVQYLVARYAPFNITWQGVMRWEDAADGRALMKEVGLDLKKMDPYDHPRSSNSKVTSSPLLPDGWMTFVITNSTDDQLGSVEHQLYTVPFVGVTTAQHLWSTTMNGQYPVIEGDFGNIPKHWWDFMSDTRHWELEPYFDVDNTRCVALEGIEYVNYVEKSIPLEVSVEKHGYDVFWFDPATGEYITQKKKYSGEHFTGQTPDSSHPWVLLVAREGRKESMLRSYKFDSRPVPVQEIETSAAKVPYQIVDPSKDPLSLRVPTPYSVKVTRTTRATREIMYLWTGEVAADGQGFRVLGTGPSGTFQIPRSIATRYPAVLNIRVSALNANGKAYSADKVFELIQ
ncbi:MAG TPA: DUF5060 domain-containing protein [Bryobacteraceae bacterium]|nr:DUF5060 domain-containing protein [Bryobacteraceae bacterium]